MDADLSDKFENEQMGVWQSELDKSRENLPKLHFFLEKNPLFVFPQTVFLC